MNTSRRHFLLKGLATAGATAASAAGVEQFTRPHQTEAASAAPPDPHRSSLCDDVECEGPFADVEWSADSKQLAFISSSRDHKRATLRVADAATGKVRDVIDEEAATYFEGGDNRPNWRFLADSNEVVWFSERDNWGRLYLYDLRTGKLKNPITGGEGNVSQTLRVDEKNRVVYEGEKR